MKQRIKGSSPVKSVADIVENALAPPATTPGKHAAKSVEELSIFLPLPPAAYLAAVKYIPTAASVRFGGADVPNGLAWILHIPEEAPPLAQQVYAALHPDSLTPRDFSDYFAE